MKKQSPLVNILYIILIILCSWNWIYTMIINSEIPNFKVEEFLLAESTVFIIMLLYVYLTLKGNKILNVGLLIIPNFVWIFTFIQDITYNYHIYSTIISSSMMIVVSILFIWNIYLLISSQETF